MSFNFTHKHTRTIQLLSNLLTGKFDKCEFHHEHKEESCHIAEHEPYSQCMYKVCAKCSHFDQEMIPTWCIYYNNVLLGLY